MELLVIAGVVVLAALIYYNLNSKKGLDIDGDGDIDLADAKMAVDNAKQGLAGDIVKVKTATKKASANIGAKTKAAIKKASTKKPAAKKPVVKKK